ncbi:hypothetical protein F5Y03DRAFT_388738 [Xylaria venustula]|nr:hypothetical protein F5Y03DRAFT_388738 [Xylaria venustula]
MHFTSVLLATLGATTAAAYRIDPNLPDGAYFIPLKTQPLSVDSSKFRTGTDLEYGDPILIDTLRLNTNTTMDPIIERGQVGEVPIPVHDHFCVESTEIRKEHDAVKRNLSDQCDKGRKIKGWRDNFLGMILIRYGSSIAWTCNYSRRQQQCAPNEVDNAYEQIMTLCGTKSYLTGGQICAKKWKKCYGHSTFQSNVCDNGA